MAQAKKTPIDEYLGLRKNASRDAKHLELWQTWRSNPSAETMEPLLTAFEPVFNSTIRKIRAPNVNEAALRADLQRHAIKQFQSYDPDRGASLVTHVTNGLKKSQRWNLRTQNMAYIPEDKAKHIGKIDAAEDELTETLGRAPTHDEIGAHIGLKGSLVKEIQGLRRNDIRGSTFQSDPVGQTTSRDREIISLLRPELSEDERKVYDYLYGQNGMPMLSSSNEIAQRLGKGPSHVSRMRTRILAKYKQYAG